MKPKKFPFMGVPAVVILLAGIFAIGILLIKLFWSWTIPELFPQAVSQGLIAEKISWWTALKLSVFVSLLIAVTNIRKSE